MKIWIIAELDKCDETAKPMAIVFDEDHAHAFEEHADAFTDMFEVYADEVLIQIDGVLYTPRGASMKGLEED